MKKLTVAWILCFVLSLLHITVLQADQASDKPSMVPDPPHLSAKSYVLLDSDSTEVIAAKQAHKHVKPASLTKMMTLYLVFDALKSGQIKLSDKVRISKKAWQTGGSKMFIKEGNKVSVKNLIKGVIIASGNDASVALAQYVGGTEETFVKLMNHAAQRLGMDETHFTDPTGLPHPQHYSTAYDMAILAQALIQDFPEYYHWFSGKWITHNGVRQSNRNQLLWHDHSVDGIKTGHTENAGYCLTASAKRHGMRLISVVMDTPTENARVQTTESLLNYGFRFYQTHLLYNAHQSIHKTRSWYGESQSIAMGLRKPLYVTIPKGQYKNLDVSADIEEPLEAPIDEGKHIGTLTVSLHGKQLAKRTLIALQSNPEGGLWTRFSDYISLKLKHLFS